MRIAGRVVVPVGGVPVCQTKIVCENGYVHCGGIPGRTPTIVSARTLWGMAMLRKTIWSLGLGLVVAVAAGQERTDTKTRGRWQRSEAEVAGPHTWLGTTGSIVGKWAADNFDTGLLPAAGEDVYFTSQSSQDVTSGLDQSAVGVIDDIWIQRGNDSNIGASGSPLIIDVEKLTHQGTGHLVLEQNGATVTTRTFFIDSQGDGGQNFTLSALDTVPTYIVVRDGKATIGANANLNSGVIVVFGGELLLEAHASNVFSTIRMHAGSVYSYRTGGNVHINGGAITMDRAATSITLLQMAGGTVTCNASGGIANLYAFNGILDFSQDPRPKTVTTSVISPTAEIIDHPGITWTVKLDARPEVPILP